jgi:hypothetical protein
MLRRMAGILAVRLPEARLAEVADPRTTSDWPLETLLRTALVGLLAGCKSFAETEKLTAEMSRSMARMLHIPRRVPDTTMRDVAVRLDPTELRKGIHAQIHAAHRRKALVPVGLPFGVCAIDGKTTALPDWDEARTQRPDWDDWNEAYGQQQSHSEGDGSSRMVRTLTCSLVSSRARPCIDAVPIPARTNEMGHFLATLEELTRTYDRPWILANPRSMVAVLLLRRLAYNIVTLFRSVTQRSDDRRQTPWKDILRWFYNLLIAATDADLDGLRPRTQPAAVA